MLHILHNGSTSWRLQKLVKQEVKCYKWSEEIPQETVTLCENETAIHAKGRKDLIHKLGDLENSNSLVVLFHTTMHIDHVFGNHSLFFSILFKM